LCSDFVFRFCVQIWKNDLGKMIWKMISENDVENDLGKMISYPQLLYY